MSNWERVQLPYSPPVFFGAVSGTGLICTGSSDHKRGVQIVEVRRWDGTGEPAVIEAPGPWSHPLPDGGSLASPDDNRAKSPSAFAWAPKAGYLVTASSNNEHALRLFDTSRREFLYCFGSHAGSIYNVSWSPSGRFVGSASNYPRHELKLWEAHWAYQAPEWNVDPAQLAFLSAEDLDPDSDRLYGFTALAEVDRTYDALPKWKHPWLRKSHFYGFGALAFHPNDRLLAVEVQLRGGNTRVAVYRLPTMDDTYSFQIPEKGQIRQLTWWGPKGLHLLVGSYDRSVFLIGPVTDQLRPRVVRLPLVADILAFNPKGSTLAYASGERPHDPSRMIEDSLSPTHRIGVLHFPSLQPLAELRGCARVVSLAWNRAGSELFALTSAGEAIKTSFQSDQ